MSETGSITNMIAKIELSAKIAQIALACPSCNGPVNKEIQEFKSKNYHQGGGRSSLPAMNDKKDCIANDITFEYK
jgi:hypothetical protein